MTDPPGTDFSRSRNLLLATAAIAMRPGVAAASPIFGSFAAAQRRIPRVWLPCLLELLLLFATAPAVRANPQLLSLSPTSGAPGQAVTLYSPSVVAGQSYVVAVALRLQVVAAQTAGQLGFTVPSDLCSAPYTIAFYAGGVRSNDLFFTVTSAPPRGSGTCSAGCVEVVRDEQYQCPYQPIPDHDGVLFVEATGGAVKGLDVSDPSLPAEIVADSITNFGWLGGGVSASPGWDRLLMVRRKPSCPTSGSAGLPCSFGRNTLWFAFHAPDPADPSDDRWVYFNLAHVYGRNSSALIYTTWLHQRAALFAAVIRGDQDGWDTTGNPSLFNSQYYAIQFGANLGIQSIAPFAPGQLWRSNCTSIRMDASQSNSLDSCTDGQRLVFGRRCYTEPDSTLTWTWWNSRTLADGGPVCRSDLPEWRMPIHRVFVAELDASCNPKQSFEAMTPIRSPHTDNLYRQMGTSGEWGDGQASISPDGRYVAVASLMGPGGNTDDGCVGFGYSLTDPNNPYSGYGAWRTSVCELDPTDLTCLGPDDAMTLVAPTQSPAEATEWPGFVMVGGSPALTFMTYWAQYHQGPFRGIARIDDFLSSPSPRVAFPAAAAAYYVYPLAPR